MSQVTPISQPKASVLDRVVSFQEDPGKTKVLIYGPPGVGKTVFACGAPSPILIDAENGRLSLKNHPDLWDTKVLPVDKWKDVEDIFWELKAGELPERESVIIDTITELQKRQMDSILTEAAQRDANRNPYLPFQQDYKLNTEMMRRLVIAFRDLDRNLIVTAHAVEVSDEATGTLFIRPAVTPKLAQTLEGIFDLIGYMNLEMDSEGNLTKRTLQIMPSRRVRAKTRIGGLPSIIEDPMFDMIQSAKLNFNASNVDSTVTEKVSS